MKKQNKKKKNGRIAGNPKSNNQKTLEERLVFRNAFLNLILARVASWCWKKKEESEGSFQKTRKEREFRRTFSIVFSFFLRPVLFSRFTFNFIYFYLFFAEAKNKEKRLLFKTQTDFLFTLGYPPLFCVCLWLCNHDRP